MPPLQPLRLLTTAWRTVPASLILDVESIPEFQEECYYPVNVGDVFQCNNPDYREFGIWASLNNMACAGSGVIISLHIREIG